MNVSVYTDISLLRHGEAAGGARYRGVTDDPLTAAGREQMWTAVGDECRWDGIVSSPLARCAEFARALAQRHSLPLRFDSRLSEMNFGSWDGRTAAEIMQTDATALSDFWNDPWRHGPPGGESLAQLRARVLAGWRDIVQEHRSTLVVSHGGPIRLMLCEARGHPIEQLLDIEVSLASLHRVLVPYAQVREPETTP